MKTALALGTFDGVHIAHKQVLNLPNGYKKVALVFAEPPKAVLSGQFCLLTPKEYKFRLISENGINDVIPLKFEDVRNMPPLEFLSYIKKELDPQYISCGYNYHFGLGGKGDISLLKDFCESNNIVLDCKNEIKIDGISVSSTAIREFIRNGDIISANKLLGRNFSFSGEVVRGDQRGRTIGFPTINIIYPKKLVKPKFGVYTAFVIIDGKKYKGITNIGNRPTYPSEEIISETYIFDFNDEIYGKNVTVELVKFVRGEVKFSSLAELKNQIEKDKKEVE